MSNQVWKCQAFKWVSDKRPLVGVRFDMFGRPRRVRVLHRVLLGPWCVGLMEGELTVRVELDRGSVTHRGDHRDPHDSGRDDGVSAVRELRNSAEERHLRLLQAIPIMISHIGVGPRYYWSFLHALEGAHSGGGGISVGSAQSAHSGTRFSFSNGATTGGAVAQLGWLILSRLEAVERHAAVRALARRSFSRSCCSPAAWSD